MLRVPGPNCKLRVTNSRAVEQALRVSKRESAARLEDPSGAQPTGLPHYKNAMVFTPDISNRFRHRKFLHATLSSSSTM